MTRTPSSPPVSGCAAAHVASFTSACAMLAIVIAAPVDAQNSARVNQSPAATPVSVLLDTGTSTAARMQPAAGLPSTVTAGRPAYQQLRFDEKWPARVSGARDVIDPLKHIDLDQSGHAWLTLGGQWRGRTESSQHYLLGTTPASDDVFSLWRLQMSADVAVEPWRDGPSMRLFGEVRNAHALRRELVGGTRPQDEDIWDLQNAFVDVRWKKVTVRVGRQEIALGKERLIGVSDWSNARRAYTGTRTLFQVGSVGLDAFTGRPEMILSHAGNQADSTTKFHMLSARSGVHLGLSLLDWQGYWLLQEVNASGGAERRVFGGRALLQPAARWLYAGWSLETENGIQRGQIGAKQLRAWYSMSDLTATFSRTFSVPTITVGIDAASGDHDATDGRVGTYQVLYPSLHSYGGYADLVGRANALAVRATLTSSPLSWLQVRADGYNWRRLDRSDGVYTKSGSLLRASSTSPSLDIGREVDLSATATVARHVKLQGGVAHVFAGAFLRAAAGAASSLDWSFISTSFIW